MRYKQLISGAFLLWTCIACSGKKEQAATVAEAPPTPWDNYYIGKIDFENLSPEAKGSAIYAAVIPDPQKTERPLPSVSYTARNGSRKVLPITTPRKWITRPVAYYTMS